MHGIYWVADGEVDDDWRRGREATTASTRTARVGRCCSARHNEDVPGAGGKDAEGQAALTTPRPSTRTLAYGLALCRCLEREGEGTGQMRWVEARWEASEKRQVRG